MKRTTRVALLFILIIWTMAAAGFTTYDKSWTERYVVFAFFAVIDSVIIEMAVEFLVNDDLRKKKSMPVVLETTERDALLRHISVLQDQASHWQQETSYLRNILVASFAFGTLLMGIGLLRLPLK